MLNEIRGELKSSELIFINAYCAKNNEVKSTLIKLAVEKQLDSITHLSFGPDYLIKLNPNMIMTFLKHLSDRIYKEIALEKILNVCPGLIDCWLMLGSIQNIKKAHKSLEKVLELDPTNSEAHLMIANLLIKQVNCFFLAIIIIIFLCVYIIPKNVKNKLLKYHIFFLRVNLQMLLKA